MTILISVPGAGEALAAGGGLWCKVPAEATGGAYSVLEFVLLPGTRTPLHVHHREDEILIVVEGECEIREASGARTAPRGSVVRLPKDSVHAFGNAGDTPLRLIITAIPGGLEKYFAAVTGGEATPERLSEIARDFEMEFLG